MNWSVIGFSLSVLLGFGLSGIWFGSMVLLDSFLKKRKWNRLRSFENVLAAVIPTAIILSVNNKMVVNLRSLREPRLWLVSVVTVLVTVFVVIRKKEQKQRKGKELWLYGLDGIFMEIPQRFMMQSFVFILLHLWEVENRDYYAILATAIVWCISIVVQCLLTKEKIGMKVVLDLLASFIFSMGIGYVFQQSGIILWTMAAHFAERILSSMIFNYKSGKSKI